MKGRKTFIALIILVAIISIYYERTRRRHQKGATIQISNGKVKGSVSISRNGRNFNEFLGIPFAEPPVGQLRFEAPRPYKPKWSEVYDATYFRQPCFQFSFITALKFGDEDCLYLNVFTPKLKSTNGLPVLVHFYGGLFMEGHSDMYGPKYFMDEDVVLVTLNYRVGALGFLNTYDGQILGNMGLKDQNMALQWVQENINYFGGDENKVTIFGQSAGSASVHYHMLSNKSTGLFHKAISQSGVALNPWAFYPHPEKQAKRFASLLNCPTNDNITMIRCLKSLPADVIVDIHREATDATRNPITLFVPTAEIEHEEAFLTQNPSDLINDKNMLPNKVPWLTGLVSDEGLIGSLLLIRNETLWGMDDEMIKALAPNALYFEHDPLIIETIHAYYLPTLNSSKRDEGMFKNLTAVFTDRHFHKGIHDAAIFHSKHAPVFLYYFTHETQFSLGDVLVAVKGGMLPAIAEIAISLAWLWFKKRVFGIPPVRYGICHADEIHLLFNVGPHDQVNAGDVDYHVSNNMVKLWTSFAKDHSNLEYMGTPWPKVRQASITSENGMENIHYMEIGSQAKLIQSPNLERLQFWNTLGLSNG